jgi:hypothetical protein
MKLPVYSSLEAFLAHYDALSAAARRAHGGASALSAHERDLLAAMGQVLDALDPGERTAVTAAIAQPQPAAIAGRRARAERSLRRVLAARGILQG